MMESKPGAIDETAVDLLNVSAQDATRRVVGYAIERRASDVFLMSNETHMSVHIRHLGLVRRIAILGKDEGKRLIQHFKAQAGMDVANSRQPADGRWIHADEQGQTADLRLNTVPTLHGEDLTIRVLLREAGLFKLEDLGMMQDQLGQFRRMVDSPSGLILCTGPTGSGKTATLYAAINRLNTGEKKINTIEDPIEFAVDGMRQSQTNPVLDLSFAELLKHVLRQAPDVIMIGEVRDAETARTAVRAANSGHLVMSTLHAPVAAGAVQAIKAYGVHPHFLATSLRGVVAQRLLRTLCNECKIAFDAADAPGMFKEVAHLLKPGEAETFHGPGGCDACDQTGYDGRTGVFEVMPIDRELRNAIAQGEPATTLRTMAVDKGMIEFRQAAMLKVAQGITSAEEVLRVIPREHLFVDQ